MKSIIIIRLKILIFFIICHRQMPQTVPAGQYQHHPFAAATNDTYAVYEDNFDLSLLPHMDSEVPLSPHSQLTIELPPTAAGIEFPSEYIPTTIYHGSTESQIKTEKLSWPSDQNSYLCSPQHSPPYNQQEYFTVFPPSPAPSLDYLNSPPHQNNHHQQQPHQQHQNQFLTIKQEFGLFPPSPPDSHGAPSPRCDVKGEPCDSPSGGESETCIDIDSLLQNVLSSSSVKQRRYQSADHQLLRECLQDTSFQRKHNLKPLALESLIGGWGTQGDIEPVISLALEHAKRDVQQTCAALNISPGKFNNTSSTYYIYYKIFYNFYYFC